MAERVYTRFGRWIATSRGGTMLLGGMATLAFAAAGYAIVRAETGASERQVIEQRVTRVERVQGPCLRLGSRSEACKRRAARTLAACARDRECLEILRRIAQRITAGETEDEPTPARDRGTAPPTSGDPTAPAAPTAPSGTGDSAPAPSDPPSEPPAISADPSPDGGDPSGDGGDGGQGGGGSDPGQPPPDEPSLLGPVCELTAPLLC
ncbi:MAG: hypothetical protein ACRDLD_02430 [Thermoleophilaceae bacterium]